MSKVNLVSILAGIIFVGSGSLADSLCPAGDFKACETVLKQVHLKDPDVEFLSAYDDICYSNKTFRCTKMQIMGDIPERMKELKLERKGAGLFPVTHDGKYIYIFEKRQEKNSKAAKK